MYNPLLLIDFYKATHSSQYPKGMTKIVSYFTPRMSRLEDDHLIMFGLQGYIKEYLVKGFNEGFFSQPKEKVLSQYKRVIDNTLGRNIVDYDKIEHLHDLGYLPIEINALGEGTRVPVGVPMIEITNTHPDFAWLVNTLETSISCSLWHTMMSANVGYKYRQLVNKLYDLSVDNSIPSNRALCDFSMRGQESVESAIKSSAAFCLSFANSATVPVALYLEDNYYCDLEREQTIACSISTEHSVMNSNYAIDGDEVTLIKRLLNEVYPNCNFNAVLDSYDYWNVVENILPACKEDILNHNGYLGVRGDSGDPVEIATKTVFSLWESFGGTVNSKGYKVLDKHLKVVYGDSITPQRAEAIYQILIDHGFACNNVALGVGSFSMQCLEQDGKLLPYTRDTFGIAIKATYCEVDGVPIPIYKDPKTDSGNFKKSQKGCCAVHTNSEGKLTYTDGLTFEEADSFEWNQLRVVFNDGVLYNQGSIATIRNRLWEGNF